MERDWQDRPWTDTDEDSAQQDDLCWRGYYDLEDYEPEKHPVPEKEDW